MLAYIILAILGYSQALNHSIISPGHYSTPYIGLIDDTTEYIYDFSNENLHTQGPPRVTVTTTNATIVHPLMVTVRQPNQLLSWKLPLSVETENGEQYYMNTSRTLCYDNFSYNGQGFQISGQQSPIVTLATSSKQQIDFNLIVDFPKYFKLIPNKSYDIEISPSKPQYFYYNFSLSDNSSNAQTADSNYDSVILEVTSTDPICTVASIQNMSCPVLDLNQDITYRGFYETFTTKGGITIPKYKFPNGFYVVFVVKADDYDCTRTLTSSVQGARVKNVTVTIKPSISYNDYIYAMMLTLCIIGGFYILFGLSFFIFSKKYYIPRQIEYTDDARILPRSPSGTSLNSQSLEDYDQINEIQTDRNIRLCRSQPYLTDLARLNPKVLTKKTYLYFYNVLTVAVFYGLPVVQLVIIYQKVLNETGEQDLCYYNFLCAHPLGFLSDFNHVFSNIGYVLLGILFLIITYKRELAHNDRNLDTKYGIPQHYGLFYAMGVGLIMEGVLSGSYHVCPNQTNFQFDSSFMYVMAVLCMVKLYQNRHPDINARASTTFGILAIAIVLGMIGIFENTESFWILFVTLHVLTCIYLSVKVYYMGCWKLNLTSIRAVGHVIRQDFWSGPLNLLKPCYKARFTLLFLGNICNWALAAYALVYHPKNFAIFFLLVFMSNTMLYFLFYIIMKYLHKERVKIAPWVFLFISFVCAVTALYFFLHQATSWSVSL
ncbi:hypothetical protein ABEB36_006791 [Hypothenemus hampei]|uniref:SID1 transmembrane family member 1-like n=1 Tax=Hypothenemus hampei TaxID=57062 RepID=A0ABD1EU06_HYPHA